MESPKIMGLRGIHSTEALCMSVGMSFCPWCRKEGQNEGTIVNQLCTSHYHLGLVCSHCVEYFTTSADAMCQHSQLFKPVQPMTMMTGMRNLTMLTMAGNMMSLNSARINIALSNSHLQQSWCGSHSTLVFMPGQASLASPQQSNLSKFSKAHYPPSK